MALPTRFALFVIVVLISVPVEAQYGGFLPVSDSMLQNPDPADSLMSRRTINSWGYSPLNQINRSNVGQLKMIWSRGTGPASRRLRSYTASSSICRTRATWSRPSTRPAAT